MRRLAAFAPLLLLLVLASGCTLMTPSYAPDYAALDQLKKQELQKVAVDTVMPIDPSAKVNKVTLRGSKLVPTTGNYARYLEDAIKSDFFEVNMLDQQSPTRLKVLLLQNDIDISGFAKGYGTIEAQFSVTRNNSMVFDKTIAAKTEFPSSFMGNTAIPRGQIEYPNLVQALLKNLYTDKEFLHALHK